MPRTENTARAISAPSRMALYHPFISALKLIDTGSLTLRLPDGGTRKFTGAKPGVDADMYFHDWKSLDRMVSHGDIGWGEDYALGLWDTGDIKTLMQFMADNAEAFDVFSSGKILFRLIGFVKRKIFINSQRRSKRNIHAHYDLGNSFYKQWLDRTMTYSCGLFHGDAAKTLEEAQHSKYLRILGRLKPSPSDHILEIGCGWGGFMAEAAKLGCRVTGVTLSAEQAKWAEAQLKDKTLVQVRLQDYRAVEGEFDAIASIGMFEHVGEEFWTEYMDIIYKKLKPGGKAMVQTIIIRDDLFDSYRASSDFIREHIFPGGMLPSRKKFEERAAEAGLRINDVFHFGKDYAITLDKWLSRFDGCKDEMQAMGYCNAFIRKWRFYLTSCQAAFKAGRIDVMQVELERAAG